MIRIIMASTLATLRDQAARARDLSARLAAADRCRWDAMAANLRAQEARSDAEAARDRAAADLEILRNDTAAALSRLETAVSDPQAGHSVQAEIALRVLRHQIAKVKATGDPDLIGSIRVLDNLISADGPLSQAGTGGNAARPAIEGRSAGCVCPLPYAPGCEVPCAAAGRCLRTGSSTRDHRDGLPVPATHQRRRPDHAPGPVTACPVSSVPDA